jgi:hypothetical protein
MTRVLGCHLSSSGSSTGTGSVQTIAHNLGAIPTSVRIYLPTTGEMTGAVGDATNIYPTVASGTAFNWIAEVW